MNKSFTDIIDIITEYQEFVDGQAGSYMDAMAGFLGHKINIERQIHLNTGPSSQADGQIVYVSYEDPSKPDIILNRIIRTNDYIANNREGGFNEQQQACAVLVFLFTYWEDEIRPRLAVAKNIEKDKICSDIMGDLRIIRNAILHTKRIVRKEEHKKLKKLKEMFVADHLMNISYTNMHQIFILIKNDLIRMLGLPINDLVDIADFAVQKNR